MRFLKQKSRIRAVQVQDIGHATAEQRNVVPLCSGMYRKITRYGKEKVKVGIRSDTQFYLIILYNIGIFIGSNETEIKAFVLPEYGVYGTNRAWHAVSILIMLATIFFY